MLPEITYSYLSLSDIDTLQYRSFLEKYHGEGAFSERRERMRWYCQLGNEGFRILIAKKGDLYVGQSCAYRVVISIKQKNCELWWGVDTFVLKEMQGQGIGKKLQAQLHQDLPNFSSAKYSPTNGIIKRKCGGRGIFDFPFVYYPVSSYCTIALELVLKKLISRKINIPRIRFPYIYSIMNGLTGRSWQDDYSIEELSVSTLPLLSGFLEKCLSDVQFHVIRSEEYIKWKYLKNPRMICHVLSVSKEGQRVGIVVFSNVKDSSVVMAKAKVVKIYESVIKTDSGLTSKMLLALVVNYYRNKKQPFDGILSLQKDNYRPVLIYPYPSSELLSTIPVEKLTSGYITYSDQDME